MCNNTGAPLCAEGRRTPMHNIGAVTAVMAVRADALLKVTLYWAGPGLSLDLYILVKLSLLNTFVGGSESSTPGTFAPGSEWSWERKVHNSTLKATTTPPPMIAARPLARCQA